MAADNLAYEYYGSNAAPNAIPQKKPEEKQVPDLRKVRKQRRNIRQQERASYAAVVKLAIPIALVLFAFAFLCNSFSQVRSARLQLQKEQATLGIYLDQKNELEARLANLVSVDQIEKIAVEKLGMVKLSDENKLYVNTADKNEIVVSNEKK